MLTEINFEQIFVQKRFGGIFFIFFQAENWSVRFSVILRWNWISRKLRGAWPSVTERGSSRPTRSIKELDYRPKCG